MRGEEVNKAILNKLNEIPLMTQKRLAAEVGITRDTCRKHLEDLRKEGRILGRGYILQKPGDSDLTGYVLVKAPADATLRQAVETLIKSSPAVMRHHLITGEKYDYVLHIGHPIREHEVGHLLRELRAISSTITETLVIVGDE